MANCTDVARSMPRGRWPLSSVPPLAWLRLAELTRPIVVVGAVEEEAATSKGARAVVGRYQPLACVIGEPSGSRAVTLGYKGRLLVDGVVSRSISHTAGPERSSSEIAATFWERVRSHAEAWNQTHAGTSTFAALMPSLRSINSQQDGLEERVTFTIGYRLPPELRDRGPARADDHLGG